MDFPMHSHWLELKWGLCYFWGAPTPLAPLIVESKPEWTRYVGRQTWKGNNSRNPEPSMFISFQIHQLDVSLHPLWGEVISEVRAWREARLVHTSFSPCSRPYSCPASIHQDLPHKPDFQLPVFLSFCPRAFSKAMEAEVHNQWLTGVHK